MFKMFMLYANSLGISSQLFSMFFLKNPPSGGRVGRDPPAASEQLLGGLQVGDEGDDALEIILCMYFINMHFMFYVLRLMLLSFGYVDYAQTCCYLTF